MTFRRLVDRAIWEWRVFRMRKQREREMPELRDIRLRLESCRKQHRRGIAAVEREAQAALHANMAGRA